MAEYTNREHYIPIRRSELTDLLGYDLAPADEAAFRRLCRHLAEHYHLVYFRLHEQLKDAYAPFDPDADTHALATPDEAERRDRLDRLFAEFDRLLGRANFRKLSPDELRAALRAASHWGVNMDVDLDAFERLDVYYRGDTIGRRSRRNWRHWFRLEEVPVPIYQRLVLIVKLRPHRRLGRDADTDNVYLKLFKDIPKPDVEMLLPGGRLKMPGHQRGKLGATLLGTAGFVVYKVAQEINQVFLDNPLSFYGPLSLVLGYGYKQYHGFQKVRQSYSLQLTQSLYYQNLDNNAGVLSRLLDAAEEQECREAILAYYFLWQHAEPGGWSPERLDDSIEAYLEQRTGLAVDFEIGDALDKLVGLRFAERAGDGYRAVSIGEALDRLGANNDDITPDQRAAG
jgi:hypothetical protein